MSNEFLSLAWNVDLPQGRKFVLVYLADKANSKGVCWPSLALIAEKTGMSESTASEHLTALVRDGFVERQRRRQQSAVCTLVRARLVPQDFLNQDIPNQEIKTLDFPDQEVSTDQDFLIPPPKTSRIGKSLKRTIKEPSSRRKSDEAENPEARKLCELLADLMVDNDCKRPTITVAWLKEARLLLTKDNRPLSEAMAVLEWSQADSFWQDNIHSIQKFRTQYDALRGRAAKDGALVPRAPKLEDREHARSWLLTQWETGSVAEVAKLTGIRWTAPDLPLGVSGSKAAEEFFRADRKRWIQENHELIISTLMGKQAAAA